MSSLQQFWVERSDTAMGGHLAMRVVWERELSDTQRAEVATLLRELSVRVKAWAAIVTRHHPSQLTRLNEQTEPRVRVGPTIAALLSWAADAWELTGGLVNITMLNERIAAERGTPFHGKSAADRGWSLTLRSWRHRDHQHHLGGELRRPLGLKIDLDGVGKGWIVDRAVSLLVRSLDVAVDAGRVPTWSSCYVNGDGDIAVRNRNGATTEISVEIPRDQERAIGTLTVNGASCGVATSGTGVHRWGGRHHLIDPRTGDSARSGIAQATVVASSAREAEAWAKSIVIDGAAVMRRAEAAGVQQIIAIRDDGDVVSAPALAHLRPRSTYAPAPAVSTTDGGAQ